MLEQTVDIQINMLLKEEFESVLSVCLCWGFKAQSTQWGHVERSQFT